MSDDERVFPPDYVDPLTNVVGAENPVGIPVWPYLFDALSWTGVRPGDDRPEFRAFPVARAEAMLRFIWDVREALAGVNGRVDDGRGLLRVAFMGTVMQAEATYALAIGETTVESRVCGDAGMHAPHHWKDQGGRELWCRGLP